MKVYTNILATLVNPIHVHFAVLEAIKDRPNLQKAHFGLPMEEMQQQAAKQAEE